MDYKKRIEGFLEYSFSEFPSSEYLPDKIIAGKSNIPTFFYIKEFDNPVAEIFTEVEVIRSAFCSQKNFSFKAPEFDVSQWNRLEFLINGFTEIMGADNKRSLYLRAQEEDEFLLGEWEGRRWDFPKYEEVLDVEIYFSRESGLSLVFWEKVLDLDDDKIDDSWLFDGWKPEK
ncbi:hypothetical protein [Algoriphagus marinus]|uniref:hypothetical protein n=1 Tax=Algoriphagus marinus TaxID=1925762 RepID=UPI00094BAB8A|nr:hypothetical protein [Algoriphagus marinus]